LIENPRGTRGEVRAGTRSEVRSSTLWGSGRGGESRSSALWGKGGRGLAVTAMAALTLAVPIAASAGPPPATSYVAPELLALADSNPAKTVRVIIQHAKGADAAKQVTEDVSGLSLKDKHRVVGAVSVSLPAAALKGLANAPGMTITPDAPVKLADYSSSQLWPHQNGASKLWGSSTKPAPKAPAIAIVDSGIDRSLPSFKGEGRQIQEVVLTSLPGNSNGDGRGHGSFVAGIAAGEAAGYAGAAPNADIISIDVMDDAGMARTSDVIRAAEWIYNNRESKNIRVANFSLHSMATGPFYKDPLNKAVEKLWFAGVTVVAAAGNYGTGTGPSGVKYAPGNDPFVITVGAVDLGGTAGVGNDQITSWSAYGRTEMGFAKPEISASGRYMVGPIPAGSTLAIAKAANMVAPGYVQLSGTSFAAPVISGVAAQILARNPRWTPDQVKGALMSSAKPVPNALPMQGGVGEVNALKAALGVTNPPNPNAALNRFVLADPLLDGARLFDAVSWENTARADVSWDTVSWENVSWENVSWDTVSWENASWETVSWETVSWETSATAETISWEDAAAADGTGPAELTPEEAAAIALDPELQDPTAPAPTLTTSTPTATATVTTDTSTATATTDTSTTTTATTISIG
jgi:serine protease AprX